MRVHPVTTTLHWDSRIAWTRNLSNGPHNQQHWVFASADIVAHYSGAVQLREEDIILTEKKVNFSMGADNPMDKVRNRCSRVPTTCAVEFIESQAEVKFPNGRRQSLHER